MPRRRKNSIASKEAPRPCVSSLSIPRNLILQSSHIGRLYAPSQSCQSSDLSPSPSYKGEQYCTVDSCPNSQTCIETHPDICPYGLRDNNEPCQECQETCGELQPGHEYGTRERIGVCKKPKKTGMTVRIETNAGVSLAATPRLPSAASVSAPTTIQLPSSLTHLACPSTCPSYKTSPRPSSVRMFQNSSTQTSATAPQFYKGIENDQFCKDNNAICRGSSGLVEDKKYIDGTDVEDIRNTASMSPAPSNISASGQISVGGRLSERAPGQQLPSSCGINPFATNFRDEVPCSTCASEVNQAFRSNLKLNAITHSQDSAASVVGNEADCCEKPMCKKKGKSNETKAHNIDGSTQERDLEPRCFHLKIDATSQIPQSTERFGESESLRECCHKSTCKKLDEVNGNDTNIGALNHSHDSDPRCRYSSLKPNSVLSAHRSAFKSDSGLGKITSEKLDEPMDAKDVNIGRLNKEQSCGKRLFLTGITENISPPIRIISGLRVCEVCRQPAQLPAKSKECVIEETTRSSATSPVKGPTQGCSCHFPPAFKQYGCTGYISGNCDCGKQNS